MILTWITLHKEEWVREKDKKIVSGDKTLSTKTKQ